MLARLRRDPEGPVVGHLVELPSPSVLLVASRGDFVAKMKLNEATVIPARESQSAASPLWG